MPHRADKKHASQGSGQGAPPGPRPQVSVVLATYNRGPALRQLLDDLAAQDIDPAALEVIVVDDGSRVPAAEAVGAYRAPYALRMLRQDNAGPAAARDRGVHAARAELVIITDDDMRVRPDFVRQHLEAHAHGATVVLGQIASSTKLASMPLFERFHALQLERFERGVREGRIEVHGVHVCTGNISFQRADYVRLGGFDPQLRRSEDRELGVRLEQAGAKLAYCAEAIVQHESDHSDLDVWLKRALMYGIFDRRIAQKHPDVEMADPWRFFFLVSPISRPLLLGAVAAPALMGPAVRLAMQAAVQLDAAGLPRPALLGTTLAYGLQYFRGMREDAGSLRQVGQDFLGYLRKRRRARHKACSGPNIQERAPC